MAAPPLFGDHPDHFNDPVHLAWLETHRESLLDFYQPTVCRREGGYAWLGDDGTPLPDKGAQLWLGTRMIHCFSLAAMMGRPGASAVVEHGLDFYVDGPGRDREYGAWYPVVGGTAPEDRKELYGIAQMLLAGSSAVAAGFSRGRALMDEALAVIDRHYWLEERGRCAEGYDRSFTDLDPYRGQNANMHLTEAYLAAYEVTRDPLHLSRATRIAGHIAGQAADTDRDGSWRLPEHFDEDWTPILDYNVDQPRHPFRPFGSQIGHWLEWSKLLLQIDGLGEPQPWLATASAALFRAAVAEGWLGSGGFCYTVDFTGRPVVRERYFWEPPEAMGAAKLLWDKTGDPFYQDWYRLLWEYSDQHFVDHDRGGWHSELDDDSCPVTYTWDGKPDLYHVYQATLYPFLPTGTGLATWAAGTAGAEPEGGPR